MIETSLPLVLRERASLQPDDVALTFIDYERDWEGSAESLTWSELHRQATSVARQLNRYGHVGDRALILAPQGLDYIVAFLGALASGRIAVPLGGGADDRTRLVLRETSPTAVLTTSSLAPAIDGQLDLSTSGARLLHVDVLRHELEDGWASGQEDTINSRDTAYLQYTSGSTRQPAGVMISHSNLTANFRQITADYFLDYGEIAPPGTTTVSWLPFYHDLGLILGICAPILAGVQGVAFSPAAFLQRPARWMQLLASHSRVFSAAPNFAYDLAARRTTDEDMTGLDLSDVLIMQNGAERVQPSTLRRFVQRFAPFGLRDNVIRPSYGLAEATVYVATRTPARPPAIVHFDGAALTAGQAKPSDRGGTALVSYGAPRSQMVRIVNPDTRAEVPEGTTGEVWVHGAHVSSGYWSKPRESEHTFAGVLTEPSTGTPATPWLRTGDLGFFYEGELFVVGRIKDLLIIHGRNHAPDDIEATIQEVTKSRVAAISVADNAAERLVVVLELKIRGNSKSEEVADIDALKREVRTATFASHGLSISDLVLVAPGSIPITTSGKVRRAACREQYCRDEFVRRDA